MSITTNKSLVQPAFNNTSGTLPDGTAYTSWDSPLNYNETVLDNALGSPIAISVGGVVTTQTFTLAQYQTFIINFSGALTVNLIYNFPTGVGGRWLIRNSCTGNFSLSVGSNGSTIVIPSGMSYYVYVDTSTAPYISFLNVSSVKTFAGNPNGSVAGNSTSPASIVWDSTNNKLWVCTTGGIASAAVWTADYQGIFASANTWTAQNIFTNSTGAIATLAGPLAIPGGRLTLTSATSVLTSDVSGATSIYYTPYLHNFASLYDGTNFATWGFSELSQALSDATKSPAASVLSSGYDVFLWNDAGTLRATRGPPWTSIAGAASSRGSGAGTTELIRTKGVLMNANAIANGPAAQRGIYLGSFATNASNTVDWVANPAAAAGGGNARIGLWNMYNRIDIGINSIDSTATWTYASSAVHAANASNLNRITLFVGLSEDAVDVIVNSIYFSGTQASFVGIGLDSTTVFAGVTGVGYTPNAGTKNSYTATYRGLPGLGSHFFQWLEALIIAGTATTFYGQGATYLQSGITMRWKA